MRKTLIFILSIFITLTSCEFYSQTVDSRTDEVVATVNKDQLLISEVVGLGNARTKEDSSQIIKSYAESWIKKKLIYQTAITYLEDDEMDFEKQLEDYELSLINYTYEKKLIQQKLDTVVSELTIRDYYQEYSNNFKLEQSIYLIKYVKLAANHDKLDSVKFWMNNINDFILKTELEKFCFQNAVKSSINDSVYILHNILCNELEIEETELNLREQKNLQYLNKDEFITIFKVESLRNKGEIAPLSYVKENIKKILLNKKKLELIDQTYKSIYNNARDNKTIVTNY